MIILKNKIQLTAVTVLTLLGGAAVATLPDKPVNALGTDTASSKSTTTQSNTESVDGAARAAGEATVKLQKQAQPQQTVQLQGKAQDPVELNLQVKKQQAIAAAKKKAAAARAAAAKKAQAAKATTTSTTSTTSSSASATTTDYTKSASNTSATGANKGTFKLSFYDPASMGSSMGYGGVAANLSVFPKGTRLKITLSDGTVWYRVVNDTGGFAAANPRQLDVAMPNSQIPSAGILYANVEVLH
ncbi:hydrolase [Lacticaseibacillus nasuensis]|uniref:Cell wall-associated hydrolase n=1 Tax=Lacticaseibacillus nasuensis JCM 17158 TaxID=1291734 RepID=A0A0R1JQS7_9LACO|nr:cell wall-associated hydrolase [Lacticaseibacillus nasuensis JCM 17158]